MPTTTTNHRSPSFDPDTGRGRPSRRFFDERGQGTVEYALVLLGAAAVALAVVAWFTRTGMICRMFDTVIGQILQHAG